MVQDAGHPSPVTAALSEWPSAAQPHVVSVDERGDKAQVHLSVGPSYDYWVICVRRADRWHEAGSGNAPRHFFFDSEWGDGEDPND